VIDTQQSTELGEAACPLCGCTEALPFLKAQHNLYGSKGDAGMRWNCRAIFSTTLREHYE